MTKSRFWGIALLTSALGSGACGEDTNASAPGTAGAAGVPTGGTSGGAGAGAGTAGSAPVAGQAGEGGGANGQAPSWVDAPTGVVAAGQGRDLSLTVTMEDPDGDAITATVSAPADVEATLTGSTLVVHPSYEAQGERTVTVTLTDATGLVREVPVQLEVRPLRWLDRVTWTSEGPEAREHASTMLGQDGSIYVFGGGGYSPYGEVLSDAWRFDPATSAWTKVTLTGDVPPAAGSLRGAGSPGESYFFGGYDDKNGLFNALYRVTSAGDTLTFALVTQKNMPGARALFAIGHDAPSKRLVLFGGAGSSFFGDTWYAQLDDAPEITWTKLKVSGAKAPSPRFGMFYGMEPSSGRLIVYSGQIDTDAFADDTWSLDVRAEPPTWTKLAPSGTIPPGRRNGTAVLDPDGPRLFVFGGTSDGKNSQPGLFALDLRPGKEAWAQLDRPDAPEVRSSGFGVAVQHRVWMGFGNTLKSVFRDWSALGEGEPGSAAGAGAPSGG